MIILEKREYKLVKDEKKKDVWHVLHTGIQKKICPCCKGKLKIKDTRKRIIRTDQGKINWIQIYRMRCLQCQKIHSELPDCIVPYKQYATKHIKIALEAYVDKKKSYFSIENSTYIRWYKWFIRIIEREIGILKIKKKEIEKYLKQIYVIVKQYYASNQKVVLINPGIILYKKEK